MGMCRYCERKKGFVICNGDCPWCILNREVTTMVDLTDLDMDVIMTLADNNLAVSATARKLFMHRNTAVYHVQKIKKATGLDPLNFYDMIKLVEMVKARRTEDGICKED